MLTYGGVGGGTFGGASTVFAGTASLTGGSITGVTGVATILAQSWAATATPADTTEDTLVTVNIAANLLGANGGLRITSYWSFTNNANNKTPRIRFSGASGATFMSFGAFTSQVSFQAITTIFNRALTNSQVGGSIGITQGNAAESQAIVTAAVDTTQASTLLFTGQKASAGDALTLEGYTVESIKP